MRCSLEAVGSPQAESAPDLSSRERNSENCGTEGNPTGGALRGMTESPAVAMVEWGVGQSRHVPMSWGQGHEFKDKGCWESVILCTFPGKGSASPSAGVLRAVWTPRARHATQEVPAEMSTETCAFVPPVHAELNGNVLFTILARFLLSLSFHSSENPAKVEAQEEESACLLPSTISWLLEMDVLSQKCPFLE